MLIDSIYEVSRGEYFCSDRTPKICLLTPKIGGFGVEITKIYSKTVADTVFVSIDIKDKVIRGEYFCSDKTPKIPLPTPKIGGFGVQIKSLEGNISVQTEPPKFFSQPPKLGVLGYKLQKCIQKRLKIRSL